MVKKETPAQRGRPPMFSTPEQMQAKIDEYFETKCKSVVMRDEDGKPLVSTKGIPVVELNPPTVAGLALYLGFDDRRSLYDYKDKPDFTHTVKKAISRVEEYAEKQLTTGAATGAIFWLKNHGWADTTKQELTGADGGPVAMSHTVDMDAIRELNEMLK